MSRSILILAPQIYGIPGGIQVYMRRLWETVNAYGDNKDYRVFCVSLNDSREERELHSRPVRPWAFVGCKRNRAKFILEIINQVRRLGNSLLVIGHIRLAPMGYILKKLGLVHSYILVLYGDEVWKRLQWLERKAAGSAARIVSISWYTAHEFCKCNGELLERIRIIPPTLAEEQLNPPVRAANSNTGEFSVLTVGRLSVGSRDKGIDTLIKAVRQLRDEGVRIKLTVVGDGDDMQRVKGLVAAYELNGQVTFLGRVQDDRLQQLYQECDVFAMPSRKEGFGIVYLEAMRFGKPCIGGNHGGAPEVIIHGVDGYLVNNGDVDQIAHYLAEFSANSWLRQEMGLKAYEKVKSNYLFPQMAGKWSSLLDECLSE